MLITSTLSSNVNTKINTFNNRLNDVLNSLTSNQRNNLNTVDYPIDDYPYRVILTMRKKHIIEI